MPKPSKGPRLGGGPAHERLMLNTMAGQLFTHKRIQTTETKAKRLQPVAERLITFAKRGDLSARRRVLRQITDKSVVHELFTEIAPLVELREGGYTRIVKTGFRKGDRAPLAVIELVLDPVEPKSQSAAGTPADAAAASETVEQDAPDTAPEAAATQDDEAAKVEATDAEATADSGATESASEDDTTTEDAGDKTE